MKIKAAILITFVLSMVFAGTVAAQTIVRAETDSTEYSIGESVKVRVTVENNPGLHNLYFDLEYDESVLSFEEVRDGSLLRRLLGRSELLYADNSSSEGFSSTRTVVSFTMQGDNAETTRDGTVVELEFRVIGLSSQEQSFRFCQQRGFG